MPEHNKRTKPPIEWTNVSLSFNDLTDEQRKIIQEKFEKIDKELADMGIYNCAINTVYWESGYH